MQKMVNQLGSSTDSQELRNKLYVKNLYEINIYSLILCNSILLYQLFFFRHQIQHYTQQLAKDTSGHLRDLANNSGSTSPGEQRQRKMQRERLQDEFTTALNSFQVIIQICIYVCVCMHACVYM